MGAPRLSGTTRPLRTLEAIARLGSVSAAARELGYTQSAASQQLAALEREAGVTLIERTARPLRLTETGGIILAHARGILAGFTSIEASLDEIHRVSVGRLRVACFVTSVITFVPAAIAAFARDHPRVAVDLSLTDPARAIEALRAGAADVAVTHRAPNEAAEPGLRRQLLLENGLRAVLARSHPLATRAELRLQDLAAVPLILPNHGQGVRAAMERLLREGGVDPRVAYEIDDPRAAQAMAAAGLGVTMMHDLAIQDPRPPGLVVIPITDAGDGARAIDAVTLTARRLPAADSFIDILRSVTARRGARPV